MPGHEREVESVLDVHVLSMHVSAGDSTPLQMISAQQLEYYQRIEAAYLVLLERQADLLGDAAKA